MSSGLPRKKETWQRKPRKGSQVCESPPAQEGKRRGKRIREGFAGREGKFTVRTFSLLTTTGGNLKRSSIKGNSLFQREKKGSLAGE